MSAHRVDSRCTGPARRSEVHTFLAPVRGFALLCLTLATGLLFAIPTPAQQDPQAAKILDAMSAKYAALKSFQASFAQALENPAAKLKQNLSGDMIVSGPKYYLVLGNQRVFCDGTTTWTYAKDENEVTITDTGKDEDDLDLSPPSLFTFYKTGYKYQLLKTVKQGGLTYNLIELSPLDKTNDVFKVQLLVSQMDKSLGSVKTFKKNGTLTTLTFKNFKPNTPVTQSTFTFNKAAHPGVKVVDLRDPQDPQVTPTPTGKPPLDNTPLERLRPRKPKFGRPKLNR